MRRAGIFGWGLVAPKSPNIDAFARNLAASESWLQPFNGFGPDTFLVGTPDFSFEDYRAWIEQRFPPNRFSQLETKMGWPVKYAIGAFIQALEQNPGLEPELRRLGTRTHVYVGTGLGDLPTCYEQSLAYYHSERRWNRFWAHPERNPALREFLAGHGVPDGATVPQHPDAVIEEERDRAEDAWWKFWAARSSELQCYLQLFAATEAIAVEGEVESGKMSAIKEKRRQQRKLQQQWHAPEAPWEAVSANLIWNIANIPAAQISMLGGLTGMAIAPVAACSTFGVTLKMAMDAIKRDEVDAVVIGATDPPPHPISVGAFYNARVIAADGQVSKPLTELRGTHISGGAVIWILGELEHMRAQGFRPLGLEPVGVGITSDADHIITPSQAGPTAAIRRALEAAGVRGEQIDTWDLHATATPGDWNEVELVRSLLSEHVVLTARKGIFGHGMSACGGWELSAQFLGYAGGQLFPTSLQPAELNAQIAGLHQRFVFDQATPAPTGPAGKLSMGIGGINACVISRPWDVP